MSIKMSSQAQSRTQGLIETIKYSPSTKQQVIEMFESMSITSPNAAAKAFFSELASIIKKNNPHPSQYESYFNAIDEMPMNFKECSNTIKFSEPKNFLYIKDSQENVVCKYELFNNRNETYLESSNNARLSDRITISYNNGKCFIQELPMSINEIGVSVLVSNPQIYDGNLFIFNDSAISCFYKKGTYSIKYRANGVSFKKKFKKNSFDYKVAPGFNLCCEKAGTSYSKDGSIVNENKKWIIRPHNGEKVIRALHTMETYKAGKLSYPLTAYDGMEIIFTSQIYKVSIKKGF